MFPRAFSLFAWVCFLAFVSVASVAAQEGAPSPIEVEADMLEVDRAGGTALFSGSVRASQEGLRLHADRLKVFYDGRGENNSAENNSAAAEITRLEASGNVFIDSANGQSAQAQWATFEVAENRIILGDRVSLLQGENIIAGGETVMDLASGEARMLSAADARVRGLFVSGSRLQLSQPASQP